MLQSDPTLVWTASAVLRFLLKYMEMQLLQHLQNRGLQCVGAASASVCENLMLKVVLVAETAASLS